MASVVDAVDGEAISSRFFASSSNRGTKHMMSWRYSNAVFEMDWETKESLSKSAVRGTSVGAR